MGPMRAGLTFSTAISMKRSRFGTSDTDRTRSMNMTFDLYRRVSQPQRKQSKMLNFVVPYPVFIDILCATVK